VSRHTSTALHRGGATTKLHGPIVAGMKRLLLLRFWLSFQLQNNAKIFMHENHWHVNHNNNKNYEFIPKIISN
jgi:hypothetical protein